MDALKAKLAVQEIELQQKNEAADRLIEIVGIETAKVQNEKAFGKIICVIQISNNGHFIFYICLILTD